MGSRFDPNLTPTRPQLDPNSTPTRPQFDPNPTPIRPQLDPTPTPKMVVFMGLPRFSRSGRGHTWHHSACDLALQNLLGWIRVGLLDPQKIGRKQPDCGTDAGKKWTNKIILGNLCNWSRRVQRANLQIYNSKGIGQGNLVWDNCPFRLSWLVCAWLWTRTRWL